MPYSQALQMTKGKLESNQSKMTNCSADLAFAPDNDFMELLWENGQIVMQGQSSRNRKSSLLTSFSSRSPKVQEKDNGDAVIPNIGRNGNLESVVNDFSSLGHSGHVGLEQDDEIVPWMNYHIDNSLQNDYFFPELSGTNLNPMPARNNVMPVDKNSSFGQVARDTLEYNAKGNSNLEQGSIPKVVVEGYEPTRCRGSQFFPSLQQCRSSGLNQKSRVSDFISNNNNISTTHRSHCGNLNQTPISASGMLDTKMPKKDSASAKPPQPNNNMGLMNFSHFSRPAALVKANLQSIGGVAASSSNVDRSRSNDKAYVNGSSPMEHSVVESTKGLKSVAGVSKVDLDSSCKPLQEPVSVNQSEAICHEDVSRNNNSRSPDHALCQSSSFAASAALGRPEGEKAFVSVVASSSVCSGNSDPKHGMKRKSWDAEESGFQSEDVEDESVDVKKTTKGPKRSRAAEVHNLSERRRRDRINEKMRALQELIPNCNKVDKASMLDEAIEYLKTLQLQVQIMSMGSGLCMPPMMLPAGMQQIRTPHMAHFSPSGTGMGMGVGYGMGMIDMSCSSGYPLIPMPSMHGAQFPCSSIPGAAGFNGMAGSSLQMFGIPGQGLPMSLPGAPYIPLSGFSMRPVSSPDMLAAACTTPVPDSSLPSSSKDQRQDINLQPMNKMGNDCSQMQTSTQVTEECFGQRKLVKRNNRTMHVNDAPAAANAVGRKGISSNEATSCD